MKKSAHFVALEPCPVCKSYRYLTLRPRKRSYEVILIHREAGTKGKRITKIVAKVPLVAVDIHTPNAGLRAGNLDPGHPLSFENSGTVLRSMSETLLKLATVLDSGSKLDVKGRRGDRES
jgi:hypothetical protein